MPSHPGFVTRHTGTRYLKLAVISTALLLGACGGGGGGDSGSNDDSDSHTTVTTPGTTTTPVTQPANSNGRLLASNCFQCHGTGGMGGFENIRGEDASEVLEYLTRPARNDIMAAHAQGYTRAQLEAIIAYLQQ